MNIIEPHVLARLAIAVVLVVAGLVELFRFGYRMGRDDEIIDGNRFAAQQPPVHRPWWKPRRRTW